MMKRILIAIGVNSIALLATGIVPGITFRGSFLTLLLAGAIFGLFNAIIRPIALFLSIPALILTLGLFYFILNGLLLWIASFFLPGYAVKGPLAGILGSAVIAIVNWALGAVVGRRGVDKKPIKA
jgi:putative membrane protein